jgi:hypothetical protein
VCKRLSANSECSITDKLAFNCTSYIGRLHLDSSLGRCMLDATVPVTKQLLSRCCCVSVAVWAARALLHKH